MMSLDCFSFLSDQIKNKPKLSTRSFYKELVLPTQKRRSDLSWKEKTQTLRKKHQAAFFSFLNEKLSPILQEHEKILEIGSGPIDQGESYLSALIKRIGTFDWILTDQNDLDLTDSLPWNKDPVDQVIGCNVLDTLAYSDFKIAFQKIHTILKKEGHFIHLADLNFFTTSFLDACSQKNEVLFPASNSLVTLYSLTQAECLHTPAHPFLLLWAQQSTQTQAIALNNAFLLKIDLSPFANLVKTNFGNSLKKIDFKKELEDSLLAAAHASQFKLLKCTECPITTTVTQQIESRANVFISDLFHASSHFDPTLTKGVAQIQARFHFFLAKKKV